MDGEDVPWRASPAYLAAAFAPSTRFSLLSVRDPNTRANSLFGFGAAFRGGTGAVGGSAPPTVTPEATRGSVWLARASARERGAVPGRRAPTWAHAGVRVIIHVIIRVRM